MHVKTADLFRSRTQIKQKYSMNYCRKRAKCRKTKENEIIQELQRLDEKICNETACDGAITKYNE